MSRALQNAAVGEEFASGTKMIFNQTAAPTGWTKVTGSGNDHALRLTTGTVGTGGSVAFETAFASQTPTVSQPTATSGAVGNHSITEAQLASHNHKFYATASNAENSGAHVSHGNSEYGTLQVNVYDKGDDAVHTHSFTQPTISQPTSSAINLDVSFVDVIIATKD